jgi:hypothetical protein
MSRRAKQVLIGLIALALFILVGLVYRAQQDPFAESRLLGLTVKEVEERLGKPSFDPLVAKPNGIWDPKVDGPYYVAYFHRLGGAHSIYFENGKVSGVKYSTK